MQTNILIKYILVPALIILCGSLAYSSSFSIPFLLDGVTYILENKNVQKLSLPTVFDPNFASQNAQMRPLLFLSFQLNHFFSAYDVYYFHLLNLIMHLTSAWLVYYCLQFTLQLKQFSFTQNESQQISLITALIWLLHPLHTEAVSYLWQRSAALVGMFYLLTIACSLRAYQSKKFSWTLLAVIASILGAGCKTVICTVPIVLFLYDRIFLYKSFRAVLQERWPLYLGLMLSWLSTGSLLYVYLNQATVYDNLSAWSYLLTQSQALLHYIKLSLWPAELCFDYQWPLVSSITDCLISGPSVLILLFTSFWAFFKKPWLSFCGIWFFFILAPTSSFFPLMDVVCERRMYLPLLALAFLFTLCLHKGIKKFSKTEGQFYFFFYTSSAFICFFLAFATFNRNQLMQDPVALWKDTINKAAHNSRAYANCGSSLFNAKQYKEAESYLKKAIELAPGFPESYLSLGHIYYKRAELNKAAYHYAQVIKLNLPHHPETPIARYMLALIYKAQGAYPQAIKEFRILLKENANNLNYQLGIGATYAEMKDYKKALTHFETALLIEPQNSIALKNINQLKELLNK